MPRAVRASEPRRGGSERADVDVCGSDRRRRPRCGDRRRPQDPVQGGLRGETDRLDARRLADPLRRDSVVGVYYPPLAIRQVRELCRYRASLVRMRTACKQRLHALLPRQGVPAPGATDLFGRAGQQWLATLTLPGYAGQSLAGHRHWLAALTHGVLAVTAEVERVATTDPIVQALDGIIGIGPVLALMIRAEIGVIERFPDAAHLASYAGLVPRVEQTGARCYYGRMTRHGSPWLRWALVEAAIHRPRRRDDLGRWATRIALQKGRLKARVAVAIGSVRRFFASGRARRDLSPRRSSRHFMTFPLEVHP